MKGLLICLYIFIFGWKISATGPGVDQLSAHNAASNKQPQYY